MAVGYGVQNFLACAEITQKDVRGPDELRECELSMNSVTGFPHFL